ncbi:MAG: nucleotidyltransferase family protein [Ruminococcaceae bacterium]|nr:nucleotidyltransferase family protein [Oscillospiraceae bacterium]
MKKVAIICEFNPFHNGHKLLFDRVRAFFAPEEVCLVCIMSGNFVQRGTLSVMSKYKRAEIAADMGADLVLELPFPYSASYAQSFARAGVHIASSLGDIEYLAFGSESNDGEKILDCAEKLASAEFENALSDMLKESRNTSEPYASVRSRVFEKLYGKELLSKPNDILAIEYLLAISDSGSNIKPLFIRRDKDFSASESRGYIYSGDASLEHVIPESVYEKTVSAEKFPQHLPDAALVLFLANSEAIDVACASEMNFDLASRLVSAARSGKYKTVKDLLSAVATKKYTHARIRRALNNAFLGVKASELENMPEYTVLLSSSEAGRRALREFSKSAKINILATKSAHNKLDGLAAEQYALSEKADRTFYFFASENTSENKPYVKK